MRDDQLMDEAVAHDQRWNEIEARYIAERSKRELLTQHAIQLLARFVDARACETQVSDDVFTSAVDTLRALQCRT